MDEHDAVDFSSGDTVDNMPRLEKNWFDCIRNGAGKKLKPISYDSNLPVRAMA